MNYEQFEQECKVLDVTEKGIMIKCDVLYPGGGGQPADTGKVLFNGKESNIIYIENKNNALLINLDNNLNLKKNDIIKIIVDKERREKLARMHTGEHIFFKSLQIIEPSIKLDKIRLDEEETSLFILAEDLNWEKIENAEKITNKIIREGREVKYTYKNPDEIEDIVRIKKERIKDEKIRVVEVDNFDFSACKGTHVKNSKEIGNLLVTKFTKYPNGFEIKFKTKVTEEFFDFIIPTRRLCEYLNEGKEKLFERVKNIVEERDKYKEKLRTLSKYVLNEYKKEKINNKEIIFGIFDDIDKKQFIEKIMELAKEDIVIFINRINEKANIAIAVPEKYNLNADDMIKVIEDFGGKGGGNKRIAQGSFESNNIEKVIEKIKAFISSS